MASKEVVIIHKDGRRYGVSESDFRKLYEDDGFKIEYEADNTTPYVAPAPKASPVVAKASRADAPASPADASASPTDAKA